MTNQEILQIAMRQSAIDLNCRIDDFLIEENVIAYSKKNKDARVYLELPFSCNLVSYGNNIVASVDQALENVVRQYINNYDVAHCFETPNMHVLNDALQEKGLRICFMAEYFLPDVEQLKELPCSYEMRVLTAEDFKKLYLPQWSNALCKDRKEKDVLGVGAYDHGELIGLAGCSADCEAMWQIGIDVLPAYRRQGVACALTSRLALEILDRGRVPFYCAAWCNVKSVRNAIKSGFWPAWVEMTVKSAEFVEKINQRTQDQH
ncbi:MAG: GNAT family N-acetyltransferase [Lachnospiraceae bacterium]|nr:GNAT family N-acetyltransferase [Lachnospiraceae bacterium]